MEALESQGSSQDLIVIASKWHTVAGFNDSSSTTLEVSVKKTACFAALAFSVSVPFTAFANYELCGAANAEETNVAMQQVLSLEMDRPDQGPSNAEKVRMAIKVLKDAGFKKQQAKVWRISPLEMHGHHGHPGQHPGQGPDGSHKCRHPKHKDKGFMGVELFYKNDAGDVQVVHYAFKFHAKMKNKGAILYVGKSTAPTELSGVEAGTLSERLALDSKLGHVFTKSIAALKAKGFEQKSQARAWDVALDSAVTPTSSPKACVRMKFQNAKGKELFLHVAYASGVDSTTGAAGSIEKVALLTPVRVRK